MSVPDRFVPGTLVAFDGPAIERGPLGTRLRPAELGLVIESICEQEDGYCSVRVAFATGTERVPAWWLKPAPENSVP